MGSLWKLLFGAALAATAYASLSPLMAPPDLPNGDKLAHLAIYAVDGFLGLLAFRAPRHRFAVIAGIIAYGCLLEVLQAWVPHRQPSVADAFANALGVSLAAFVTELLSRSQRS